MANQLLCGEIAAQNGFVADNRALDGGIRLCQRNQRIDFSQVGVVALVQPGAGGDLQPQLSGNPRDGR
jgi:hypothetical protein